MTPDDAAEQLAILRPKPGDLLVLYVPEDTPLDKRVQAAGALAAALSTLGLEGKVEGFVLEHGQTLTHLPAEQLRQMGLARIK